MNDVEKYAAIGTMLPGAGKASLVLMAAAGFMDSHSEGAGRGGITAYGDLETTMLALNMAWALARSPHRVAVIEALDAFEGVEGLIGMVEAVVLACEATGEAIEDVFAAHAAQHLERLTALHRGQKRADLVAARRDLIVEAFAAWPETARARAGEKLLAAARAGGLRAVIDQRDFEAVHGVTPCGLLTDGPRAWSLEIGAAGFQGRASAVGLKSARRGPEALVPGWALILPQGEVSGRLDMDRVQFDGGLLGVGLLPGSGAGLGPSALEGEACLLDINHEVRVTCSGWVWLAGRAALLPPDWFGQGRPFIGLVNLFREGGWAYGATKISVLVPEMAGRSEGERQGGRIYEAALRAGRGDLTVQCVMVGPDKARLEATLAAAAVDGREVMV